MDRAQDGLPVIRQLPQEPDDVPRALTVKTRSWFVQEEEQLRFAGEFHTNRHPLPCLASETQYQSVSERLELEKFNDFLHISILLGFGDLEGLAQISRESHRFSNSCRALVNVHLFSCFKFRSVSVM